MSQYWIPSTLGRYLTRSPDWKLSLQHLTLTLATNGNCYEVNIDEDGTYWLSRGFFWTDITIRPTPYLTIKIDGLRNSSAVDLAAAIDTALTEKRICEELAFLGDIHQRILDWLRQKNRQEQAVITERRWLTHEMQTDMEASRPAIDLDIACARMQVPDVLARLGEEASAMEQSFIKWKTNYRPFWTTLNYKHTERELQACKDLFNRVEKNPLTQEQARAVICFDNRVQVVASAGSGKTSVMVAKAAYAIHRGFVAPERIVMLAFNKQAATELEERARTSFARLGMDDVCVEASTFHALGLGIIGKATKEKPNIPDWASDMGSGVRKLGAIIKQLMDRIPGFKKLWDLFRCIFGRDMPKTWDTQGHEHILTADGKRVRSQEEAMICNWLFYHGVNYCYEEPYEFRTADAYHRQYHPDFFYPDIGLYHEHFALDANGNPPPDFKDYQSGMDWKRNLHKKKGTTLFETTSHELRAGKAFARLERELSRRGITLDFDPERKIPADGLPPIDAPSLIQLLRTFISHVKNNCLTVAAMNQRLDAMSDDTLKHPYRMFLNIVEPVIAAWDTALADEDGIDFDDMINMAAALLENGRYEAPYDLVMVDEFQDASRARARLCRALVQKPGRYLFAVGDDWQSINRFAGADVAVMTGFQEWFGHGQVLKLEQTFRCPQALCDVSSRFISKNPAQIKKRVTSLTPAIGPVLQAFQVDGWNERTDAIRSFVEKLADGVRDASIPTGRNGKVSVYILGRYNAEQQHLPVNKANYKQWVDISFLTIHRSKGSEADYVILPGMLLRSFPSTRTDNPALTLAMPAGDNFLFGEERRLFYVALTRARRGVVMFTVKGMHSIFLQELVEDGAVTIKHTSEKEIAEEKCPACNQGAIILRTGRYGDFYACSNFPMCRYKPKRRKILNPSLPRATNEDNIDIMIPF